MTYLNDALDVEKFVAALRSHREIAEGKQLVAFTQTAKRWKATFQNEDFQVVTEGDVGKSRQWLASLQL